MKRYFISSDIHSFFDEWQKALIKKGFDVNNPEHIIVIVGDIFDRGTQPLEIYNFLKKLPIERRILIRGNHEILLKDLIKRQIEESYDISNGTLDTLYYIAGFSSSQDEVNNYYTELFFAKDDENKENQIRHEYEVRRRQIWKGLVKEIIAWIDSNEWVNYWETNNYIFTHSWIPLNEYINWEKSRVYGYIIKDKEDSYREDWRNATQDEWNDAMWGCPWRKAKDKLNQTGKTIVCGHWHTSDFFNHLTKQYKEKFDCPIFKSKRYKLIGLDACTAGSHKVNVLVLNEDEL